MYQCSGPRAETLCQTVPDLRADDQIAGKMYASCRTLWIRREALPYFVRASLVSPQSASSQHLDADKSEAHHAVKSCNLKPGQTIAIIGAGGLGQLACQYARALDLVPIAIDINDGPLDLCKRQGAAHVFNSMSNSNYVSDIKALTPKNLGVHAAAVFSNVAAAYNSAPALLRPGGVWMFIGICGKPIEVSTFALAVGSYKIASDSTGVPSRMHEAVNFTAKHGILPEVEVREGLESVNSMVEDMMAGRVKGRMGVVF